MAVARPQIDALEPAILSFSEHGERVVGWHLALETVEPEDACPVAVEDARGIARPARAAPGAVVLQSAIDAVGRPCIEGNAIELGYGKIVDSGPFHALIARIIKAAIVAEDQMARIGGIDPQVVMIDMCAAAGGGGERQPAVGGDVQRDAQHPDALRVRRIDANLTEVKGARTEIVDFRPGLPAVAGAEDAARLDDTATARRLSRDGADVRAVGLHDGENDSRVFPPHGQADPAHRSGGQALGEALPRLAAVPASINTGKRPELLGRVAPREGVTADAVGGGIQSSGIGRIHHQIDATGFTVELDDLFPRLAAVARAKQAASRAWCPQPAQGGDINVIGVARMDDDLADVVGVGQAGVAPGFPRVAGEEDAITPGHAVACVGLARADPDDLGIGGSDGDGTDGSVRRTIENRRPRPTVIARLPHTAGSRPDVLRGRSGFDDGQRRDPSAHGGGPDGPGDKARERFGLWVTCWWGGGKGGQGRDDESGSCAHASGTSWASQAGERLLQIGRRAEQWFFPDESIFSSLRIYGNSKWARW